ncbi:hypothetical protein SAMD00019534_055310, partial [Acytostelium subglobosum LB1]|uniref:hypothetical protein n=1 Tax=Acytostelium subglobosum LB1 TaxID=1410327 RepID=UPI0006450B2B
MVANEVILLSSNDNSIYLYDLRNGSLHTTYHGGNAELNGLCMVGTEHFVASQANKAMVHFYSWRKDQPLYKTPVQERGGPLAATADANYVCMGTASGSIYLWEAATGALLRVWEAHYNKITSITFTRDDAFLLSGGDDGVVNCWSLESILDREQTVLRVNSSFSDHALGITGIHCGYGNGGNVRVYTVSLDRTCRVWDLVQGKSIASIVFPTSLTSVAVDCAETAVYVGASDGIIYETDLITLNQAANESAASNMSFVSKTASEMMERAKKTFIGHNSKSITTLNLSIDGSLLISGATDGSVNIWDTFSRQVMRTISTIKGAITSINVMLNPIDLLSINMAGDNRKQYDPLQPFEKYKSTEDRLRTVVMRIKATTTPNDSFASRSNQFMGPSSSSLDIHYEVRLVALGPPLDPRPNLLLPQQQKSNGNNTDELAKLKAEIEELKKVNKKLVDRIVTETVKEGDIRPSAKVVKEKIKKLDKMTAEAEAVIANTTNVVVPKKKNNIKNNTPKKAAGGKVAIKKKAQLATL